MKTKLFFVQLVFHFFYVFFFMHGAKLQYKFFSASDTSFYFDGIQNRAIAKMFVHET
jgi:hypothetical protein